MPSFQNDGFQSSMPDVAQMSRPEAAMRGPGDDALVDHVADRHVDAVQGAGARDRRCSRSAARARRS